MATLMHQVTSVYHDDLMPGFLQDHRDVVPWHWPSMLSDSGDLFCRDPESDWFGNLETVYETDAFLHDSNPLSCFDGDTNDTRLSNSDQVQDYSLETLYQMDTKVEAAWGSNWGEGLRDDWPRELKEEWPEELGQQLCFVRQPECTASKVFSGVPASVSDYSLSDLDVFEQLIFDLDTSPSSEPINLSDANRERQNQSLPAISTLVPTTVHVGGETWEQRWGDVTGSPSSIHSWTPKSPDSGVYSSSSDLEFQEEPQHCFLNFPPRLLGGGMIPSVGPKIQSSPVDTKSGGPRRPGRPRKQPPPGEECSSDGGDLACGPQGRVSKRKSGQNKSTHLWEFMRKLLEDPEYNPQCIKWENKEQGVFRIVPGRSKVIAGLWGQRKNNPTMTFDKLSRSLRWCRTYGFLSEVPKNDGYPKKLCFRFGERALAWKN